MSQFLTSAFGPVLVISMITGFVMGVKSGIQGVIKRHSEPKIERPAFTPVKKDEKP